MRFAARVFRTQLPVLIGLVAFLPLLIAAPALAQPAEAEASDLAAALVTTLGAADFDRAGTMLTADAVVTFQNGDVSRGRDATVTYVRELFNGKGALIQAYSGSPTVTGLASLDDSTRVVTGTSTDTLTLSSGAPMVLETRWTATVVRRDNTWQVASLHLSTNMLDNPIIEKMKTTSYLLAAFGLVMGITIGIGIATLLRRRAAPSRG
ncbi:MAG: nuclear transport factor 2 family protein [Blastocatellia bacterium]|mgnify:CR=1 FL=1|jgi:hypothetical protein|nr:nuclear transport factor 2 family protein [Blastocatellia bacterium]MBK6426363.1 nuclear transport factor 2 family protein [Blastocatellia bacterium]